MSLITSPEIREVIRNTLMNKFETAASVTVRHVSMIGSRGAALNGPDDDYNVMFVYEFNANMPSLSSVPETIQFQDVGNKITYVGHELKFFLNRISNYVTLTWENMFNCRLEGTLLERVVSRCTDADLHHVFWALSQSTSDLLAYLIKWRPSVVTAVLVRDQQRRARNVMSHIQLLGRLQKFAEEGADLKDVICQGRRNLLLKEVEQPPELDQFVGIFMALDELTTVDDYRAAVDGVVPQMQVCLDYAKARAQYFTVLGASIERERMLSGVDMRPPFNPTGDNDYFRFQEKGTPFQTRLSSLLVD